MSRTLQGTGTGSDNGSIDPVPRGRRRDVHFGKKAGLAALLLALSTTTSCGDGFAPPDATPLALTGEYLGWWAKTETCSGLRGDPAGLRFYVIPGSDFACPTGRCAGRWESDGRIYVAAAYQHNEMVVRHEMLHALIGGPGHPDPPFARGCNLTWTSWTAGQRPGHSAPPAPVD